MFLIPANVTLNDSRDLNPGQWICYTDVHTGQISIVLPFKFIPSIQSLFNVSLFWACV